MDTTDYSASIDDHIADNITNITTGSDSPVPSFSTDVDISELILACFNQPDLSTEESIEKNLPHDAIAAYQPEVNYFIIPISSNHGRDKLADNLGFSYTIKEIKHSTTIWRCTIHNKQVKWRTVVHKVCDIFVREPQLHLHPAQPGIINTLQNKKNINWAALSEIFTTATDITERMLTEKYYK